MGVGRWGELIERVSAWLEGRKRLVVEDPVHHKEAPRRTKRTLPDHFP
jgi:hypothetical protein